MADQKKLSYTEALAAVKRKPRHQAAKEISDQWRTPDWLFWAVNSLVGGRLKLDLFTDGQNSKCPNYFTAEVNALQQDWAASLMDIEMEEGGKPMAYANPPYSIAQDENGDPLTGMRRIMAKATAGRPLSGSSSRPPARPGGQPRRSTRKRVCRLTPSSSSRARSPSRPRR